MPEPAPPRPSRKKRKLHMMQVLVPDVALADWKKGADEFGHDNMSSLVRTAVQFYLAHKRKTAPDRLESWAITELKKNRASLRGVYAAIRLVSAQVSAAAGQNYLRHGDPLANELEARMIQIGDFYEQFEVDVARIYQSEQKWFDGKTATEKAQVVEIIEVEE